MTKPPLRLLHLTDTHLFEAAGARLRGVDTAGTLQRVLARVLDDERRPDAILVTGDISQDETAAAYDRFRQLIEATDLPVWCIAGNHDSPPAMAARLAGPPFRLGGTLVQGGWAVLLLDSHLPGEHGGRLTASTLAWLADALQEHRSRHVLLAVHHHVLPVGSRWLDELGLQDAANLLTLIDGAPQVRAVLSGHVHQASDQEHHGVRFLTTPSTCFQFLPHAEHFAVDTRPPGLRWLDLLPDGRILSEVTWVEPE
ncbi:MAG: 3',5'-cyclic-AMP phosphodiesterase [Gammaproteobacteria bacterium]|nr:3',5'-cyclic-AMP phosphodiesterase [Gammaproteobacteria bacterium]